MLFVNKASSKNENPINDYFFVFVYLITNIKNTSKKDKLCFHFDYNTIFKLTYFSRPPSDNITYH